MSPSNFQDLEIPKAAIFNQRSSSPSLKINRDSHAIQNPSGRPKRQPVIIYTHSPRVIHTNARDFMNLVQKLTGMEQSKEEKTVIPPQTDSGATDEYVSYSTSIKDESSMSVEDFKNIVGYEENESSSILSSGITDEKYIDEVKSEESISSMTPLFGFVTKNHPYQSMDTSEYLCSSRSNFYLQYPNVGDSILPSGKGFSGY